MNLKALYLISPHSLENNFLSQTLNLFDQTEIQVAAFQTSDLVSEGKVDDALKENNCLVPISW